MLAAVRQPGYSFGPAETLLHVGRWLLPWLVVLVVACGLAYACDVQMVQAWSGAPTNVTTNQGRRWVLIEAVREDGGRYQMECLAKPGTLTTDDLVLEVSELNAIAAATCEQLAPLQPFQAY
jgi:hypothetical protein